MADSLAVLFRLRAENQASPVVKTVQADVAKLSSTTSQQFNAMQQISTAAIGQITSSLTNFSAQLPIANAAVSKVSETVNTLAARAAASAPTVQRLGGQIDSLAKVSGKSTESINTFLKSFIKIQGESAKSAAAIKFFGGQTDAFTGSVSPKFASQLESAAAEMSALSAAGTEASASIAAMAGPIGVAIIASAALAVGAFKLGEALVSVAVSAADTQGKLFDLSQQTGVSVETLAALEFAAKRVGGGIEGIVQPLGIFQRNMIEAQDPTSKMAALFSQLNITSSDTEEALRQALSTLAKLPEGARQTSLAFDLFGRGGRVFLAILKETHGDIDALVREMEELGLASTANAQQADEFNDQLAKLQTQLIGITVTIGNQVIPQLLTALKELEKVIKDNKEAIDALAVAVKAIAFLFITPLRGAIFAITSVWKTHEPELRLIVELYERLAAALQAISGTAPDVSPNAIPAQGAGPTSGLDLLNEVRGIVRGTPQLKDLTPDFANNPDLFKKTGKSDAEKAEEERRKKEVAYWKDLSSQLGKVTDEYLGVDTASKTYAVTQEILNGVLSKSSKPLQEMALNAAKNIDEITRQNKLTKEYESFVKSLNEQVDLAIKGQKTQLDLTNEFIKSLALQGKFLTATEEFWLRFNSLIVDTNKNLDDLAEKLRQAAQATTGPTFEEGKGSPGTDALNPKAPGIPSLFDPGKNVFDDIQHAMEKTLGISQELATGITDILAASFNTLAQGVGQAVQAFVLFGKVEGGFKRFAAEMIAQIAAMAAVQAVYQLAQGLAWTALNFFFPNPAYTKAAAAAFASAAVFGSIAGVAAGAGRLVAGNSFNQSSGGGDAGVGGGSPGSRSGSQSSGQAVDVDRRRVGGQIVETIHFRVRGIDVVNEFVRDYNLNGPTRVIITGDKS